MTVVKCWYCDTTMETTPLELREIELKDDKDYLILKDMEKAKRDGAGHFICQSCITDRADMMKAALADWRANK